MSLNINTAANHKWPEMKFSMYQQECSSFSTWIVRFQIIFVSPWNLILLFSWSKEVIIFSRGHLASCRDKVPKATLAFRLTQLSAARDITEGTESKKNVIRKKMCSSGSLLDPPWCSACPSGRFGEKISGSWEHGCWHNYRFCPTFLSDLLLLVFPECNITVHLGKGTA